MLETDYKVVEVDYGFDNYIKNIRDKSGQVVIKERNIILINVDKNGRTKIENEFVEDSLIVTKLIKYITPTPENNEMPITIKKEFQYAGKVDVIPNIIVLASFDQELDYETYSGIRNRIYLSFNHVMNEFSVKKFNQTLEELINSTKLDDVLKWQEIRQIFPNRYTETIN